MSNMLGRITTGKIAKPPRIIVAGMAGVGKSTFGSQFPDPLFIDAEKRTEHLDVKRVEVENWKEILMTMREVVDAKACKTLVFDTIDAIESLIHRQLCEDGGAASIDAVGGGYGRGYNEALGQWHRFNNGLEALRAVNIQCLLLAHTSVKTFKNPLGEDYDQYTIKMNAKAADFLRERADAVGFAHFQETAKKENPRDGLKKAKATTTGRRMLSFKHSPAYESKQGFSLPDQIELSYEAIKEYLPGENNNEPNKK